MRWPGKVKPGTTSDQVVCLTDLFATCAEILGARLPDTAAEDSVSLLPALLGTATGPLRDAIVHHSINGSFAIRQGRWKLALCPDSGGWSPPRPGRDDVKGLPEVQLYDLSADRAERHNVQAEHPEIVDRLTRLLEKYVADGRSTPGMPSQTPDPGRDSGAEAGRFRRMTERPFVIREGEALSEPDDAAARPELVLPELCEGI